MKVGILDNINFNEFDHLALSSALTSYKYPKDKITKLLKSGRLLKLKRGFYVKSGGANDSVFYSKEIVANLLYGPSYISLEYALSYYNIIPERVEVVTSVTSKRKKIFNTPLGTFQYSALNKRYYPAGISWQRLNDGRGFFIATREKALIDKLYFENSLSSQKEMSRYLLENLRIEKSVLKELNCNLIEEILFPYQKKTLNNLIKVIKKL